MSDMLHGAVAKAMVDDLHRTAERQRRAAETERERRAAMLRAIELRPDRLSDRGALRELAAAARQEPLDGGLLVAVLDGEIVAGVEMTTGRVVTAPGAGHQRAVELLRLRAEQLGVGSRRRRFRRRRLAILGT